MTIQWTLELRDTYLDRYECGDEFTQDAESWCDQLLDLVRNPGFATELFLDRDANVSDH